jgi:hypothetical protein
MNSSGKLKIVFTNMVNVMNFTEKLKLYGLSGIIILSSFLACTGADKKENIIDIGNLKEGEAVEKVISFKNNSGSNLKITNVRSSCHCAKVSLDKQDLKPDEQAQIKISFQSQGLRGKIVKYFSFNTTSEAKKETKLIRYKLTANVITEPEPVIWAPGRILLGNLNPGEIKTIKLEVKNNGALPLTLFSIKSPASIDIKQVLPLSISPGKSIKLDCPIKAGNKQGLFSHKISLISNDPRKKTKEVLFIGKIK